MFFCINFISNPKNNTTLIYIETEKEFLEYENILKIEYLKAQNINFNHFNNFDNYVNLKELNVIVCLDGIETEINHFRLGGIPHKEIKKFNKSVKNLILTKNINLEKLDFIGYVPKNLIIKSLPKLEYITLYYEYNDKKDENLFQEIEQKEQEFYNLELENLPELKIVKIDNKEININFSIKNCDTLEEIIIRQDFMHVFNFSFDQFNKLKNLTKLTLINIYFEDPTFVFPKLKLKELFCMELDVEILDLNNLEYLEKLKLSDFPNIEKLKIDKLNNLKDLCLSDTNLYYLKFNCKVEKLLIRQQIYYVDGYFYLNDYQYFDEDNIKGLFDGFFKQNIIKRKRVYLLNEIKKNINTIKENNKFNICGNCGKYVNTKINFRYDIKNCIVKNDIKYYPTILSCC